MRAVGRLAVGAVFVVATGCGDADDTAAIVRVRTQVCACKDQVCASAALATLPAAPGAPSAKARQIAAETLRCFADRPPTIARDAGPSDAATGP